MGDTRAGANQLQMSVDVSKKWLRRAPAKSWAVIKTCPSPIFAKLEKARLKFAVHYRAIIEARENKRVSTSLMRRANRPRKCHIK